jgi:hypothetical protein
MGHFYEAELSFKSIGYMAMAHILVGMKLTNGLVDCISIQHQGCTFTQELDYEGIPFRCGRCHAYGHLAKDCPLQEKNEVGHKIFLWPSEAPLPKMTPPTLQGLATGSNSPALEKHPSIDAQQALSEASSICSSG